jgi:hypothetical protein
MVKSSTWWFGYSDKDNSWESPQESFQAAINEYEAAQPERTEVAEDIPESVPEPTPVKRGRPPKKAVPKATVAPTTAKMTVSRQLQLAEGAATASIAISRT